jgi:hypothetical protein
MKKIFLILFILISGLCKSQINADFWPGHFGKFRTFFQPACGVGSLHILVQRSQLPNQLGYYAYEIYFATNSYLPDCRPSNTYVSDIELMSADIKTKTFYYPMNYYKFWVIIGQTNLVYTIYHTNPNLIIKVKTGYIKPSVI